MSVDLRQSPSPDAPQLVTLLTVTEIARSLGVGERYVYRLVSERRIPYFKVGHYIRFDPEEVADWLEQAWIAPTVRRRDRR